MFVKLNPFMPGDILDKCRLDLSYFFEYNFGIMHRFTKYYKEIYRGRFIEQLSFKYFLIIAFVGGISTKLSINSIVLPSTDRIVGRWRARRICSPAQSARRPGGRAGA